MWMFTKHGFFSIVCARAGDGGRLQPVDIRRVAVRSRFREHLEAIIRRYPELLGGSEILQFSKSDYQYRIFVPKKTWERVAALLVSEVNYDNFKDEVDRHGSPREYADSLHSVWDEVYKSSINSPLTSAATARKIDGFGHLYGVINHGHGEGGEYSKVCHPDHISDGSRGSSVLDGTHSQPSAQGETFELEDRPTLDRVRPRGGSGLPQGDGEVA